MMKWLLVGLALLAFAPVTVRAQDYPSRTVTVIVPFPPGGSVDGVARIIVDRLNQTLGSHFIVENRAGGASGNVGANVVAKADADGYTLLLTASLHVVNPFLYKGVRFDVVRDFTPVTLIAKGPLIVSTTPSVPANNLKDFFDLVRNDPKHAEFPVIIISDTPEVADASLQARNAQNVLLIPKPFTGSQVARALHDLLKGNAA